MNSENREYSYKAYKTVVSGEKKPETMFGFLVYGGYT
jgi:hypothetical protein